MGGGMTVRIITGDCRDVMAQMEPESVDCILTDPPYGETSLAWDRWVPGWPALARRVLKHTGSMWCFGSTRMFLEHAGEFAGWVQSQDVVWEKHNGSGFLNDRFRRVHELALHFYRDDAKWSEVYKAPQYTPDATARIVRRKTKPTHFHGERKGYTYTSEDGGPRLMRSVMFARSEHGRAEHPTQKPIEIVEPLLLYACPQGGVCLDPFAGSGTTGVVAKQHGINCTLIEGDPEFAEIARVRIAGGALFAQAEA
jgi:site-specific DNA-methyltransferase (adenine-specific)